MAPGDEKRPLSGLKVLDVGCGGGILSVSLARLGATVHGIDVAEKNIQVARAYAEDLELPIYYDHVTVEELAATRARYDVVFNMEVVEHVADLDAFMKGCCRLVNRDGAMFVSTINRNPLAWLMAVFGAEYVLRWLPKGTHHYSMLRKPTEIAKRLRAGGLNPASWRGVAVNPLTKSFRLTRTKMVNYMVFARRPITREDIRA